MNHWGKVTGIRPVKIVRDMIEQGLGDERILHYMTCEREVSRKKAEMSLDIAKREISVLSGLDGKDIGIYIGIPFCKTRCLYCSFVTNTASSTKHLMQPFTEALKREIDYTAGIIEKTGFNIVSMYIGGGTPTALPANLLDEIIKSCFGSFDLRNLKEFTVEAGRPDTIDREKLEMLKSNGVTRISINPQSMNDKTLEFIGRLHKAEDIVKSFELARKCGFGDINMDIIAGLPLESLEQFKYTVDAVESLGPESTTVHTMSVKRGSKLHETLGAYTLTEDGEVSAMIDYAYGKLLSKGKNPYYLYRQKNMVGDLENIGYSKAGHECLYNIMMMEETASIFSLGSGGVTKIVNLPGNRIERVFNVKEVYDYVSRVDEMCKRKDNVLLWLGIL